MVQGTLKHLNMYCNGTGMTMAGAGKGALPLLIGGAYVRTMHAPQPAPNAKETAMTEAQIAPMTMNDYPEAMSLWRVTPGIGLSAADEPDVMRAYLQRNPGLSQCARLDGRLAGTVLAGHDGRRGYLHHLCVGEGFRHRGVGRMLVAGALAALAEAGLDKAHAFLFTDNETGRRFWEKIGWTWRTDIGVISRYTPKGAK